MIKHDNQQHYLPGSNVCRRYEISTSTLYRWIQEGLFPKGIKIGPRAVRWKMNDLIEWENRERV